MLRTRSQLRNVALLLTALGVGCGEDSKGPGADDPSKSADPGFSDYGIEALVGKKRVRFLPADAASSTGGSGNQQTQSISIPDGDGTREVIPDEVNGVNVSGYYLLLLAAGECGIWAEDSNQNPQFPDAATAVPEAWQSQAWYLLGGKRQYSGGATNFKSCDDVLFHEEALLCTASKLEEVASAVEPVVWNRVDRRPYFLGPDLEQNPVILPPQSQKNRFIVRDLALNALAPEGSPHLFARFSRLIEFV